MSDGLNSSIAKVENAIATTEDTGHGHMQKQHLTSSEESEKISDQDLLVAQEIMREEYHIRIKIEERPNLDRALDYLGIKPNFVSSMYQSTGVTLDFMVDLSKYELLYIRLTVNGTFVNVTEWNRSREKILHTDPEVPR